MSNSLLFCQSLEQCKAATNKSYCYKYPLDYDILPKYTGVPTDDEIKPKEKPWQRIPSPYIVLLLGAYFLLGYLTQLVEDELPTPLRDSDINRDTTDRVSEESSWRYLYEIMGEEPRVCGTEYHLNKTRDMKAIVDRIAVTANQNVRTDWQIVTGDYFLKSAAPFVSYYDRASNIAALLEGESGFHGNGTIGSSILVNCHYDSVPYALGASDNVIFCAAMAETLARMSKRTKKLKHNIIFLFNGAEENPLQGSHGFLQHPWSKGVTTLVNLDSAGSNGKATIFQVTDPRILSAYKAAVTRPSAQSLGEFLFSSGVIPSDTDFRIFRDFGDVHGVDIAFTKWGNLYHTRFDRPEYIRPGVLQWAGDMLLGLLTQLADRDDIGHKVPPAGAVYYDYLNWFVVWQSPALSLLVDAAAVLAALVSTAHYVWLVGPRLSTVRELAFAVAGRVAALVVGAGVAALVTLLMVATTVQLRYLSRPWLVVALYWVPYLVSAVTASHLYDSWRSRKSGLNRSIRTLQAMTATRVVLTVLLSVSMCVPSLATARYALSVPLLMTSVTSLVTSSVVRTVRLKAYQHLVLECVVSLPCVMFTMSLALRLNALLLPTVARSASANPDLVVAAVNVALAAVVSAAVSGVELLFSRRRLWLSLAGLGAAAAALALTPLEPYAASVPSVQRHYWFHTQITTYNINGEQTDQTTGVFVSRQDAYTTERVLQALKTKGIHLNTRTDFEEDCERHVYCNLPLYRTSFARNLARGLFLYTGGPTATDPPAGLALSSRSCVGDTCVYSFTMTGTAHNLITLVPSEGVTLTAWTLSSPASPSTQWGGRPLYVIFHSVATYTEPFEPFVFNVTLNMGAALSGAALRLSLHAHRLHHPHQYSAEYAALLHSMPDYFNVASILTFRNNYVF
uniref:FXNA-like protease n=1 Tax=Bombyx mori TaxID=7091 RepID=A0A8R2DJK1_BOMMO|nr:endoplasmic reticulum metallopeptidase 1 isoform X3 [Bombyx mori]